MLKKCLNKYHSFPTLLFVSRVKNKFNFGDELGLYIINKISSDKFLPFTPLYSKKHKGLYILLSFFKTSILNGIKQTLINLLSLYRNNLIALGSVINQANKNSTVWGSGIINRFDNININANFNSVRGPLTLKRLHELGYSKNLTFGDPALLLPIIYRPQVSKEFKFGIIPHVSELMLFKNFKENSNLKVIDFSHENIENIIDQINECEKILSSSLHGLIVALAYNIETHWAKFSNNISGDGIKYIDFFESIKLKDVKHTDFSKNLLTLNIESLDKLTYFKAEKNNIDFLQKKLIYHAPFNLRNLDG